MIVDLPVERVRLPVKRADRLNVNVIRSDGERIVVVLDELVCDKHDQQAEGEQSAEELQEVSETFTTSDDLKIGK